MQIDEIDKTLLNIIQSEFPLGREPFSLLGATVGIYGSEVIKRIERLKATGIIRLIGPVMNPKRLGYQTTLVAAKISTKQLDRASLIIRGNPMVSHCYERDHDFNIWLTLAVPVTADPEDEVGKLGNQIGSETMLNLPAIKTFKIGAYFPIDSGNSNLSLPPKHNHHLVPDNGNNLTTIDRAVINALQLDLPLIERPFDLMSAELRIGADEFLNQCRALLRRGIMRRYSASINQYKLGFKANAMSCWKVPKVKVNMAGKRITIFPEVSHCYERQTNTFWPYNLFAMVHAYNRKQCREIIDKIQLEAGLDSQEHINIFSTKEVKKTRVKYTV